MNNYLGYRHSANHPPRTKAELCGRVLVVDDTTSTRSSTARFLSQLGLEVTTAVNGEEALDIALLADTAGYSFQLVLMDVRMPVMDGIESTRLFRHGGFTSPIIAFSSCKIDGIARQCIDAGCDLFLAKPVAPDVLKDVLEQYLAVPAIREPCVA